MRSPSPKAAVAVVLGAALVTSCADGTLTGPEPAPKPSLSHVGPSCQVIDFNAFAHGDQVSTVSVFGTTLTVSALAYTGLPLTPVVASTPRAYSTANVGGDTDLEFSGPFARCPGCAGLGNLLVTQEPGGPIPLDATYGGELTLSGFGSIGHNVFIKSFTAVDNDTYEQGFRLFVDGTLVGAATPLGDGSVQTVNLTNTPTITNSIKFILGTGNGDLGSGAVDNIEVCIREHLGDDGCTPGYWKNHTGSWVSTGFSPTQTVGSVFSGASAFPALASSTLLQALNFDGGGGAEGMARILLRAAVAALLNAAHPNVDYGMTTADIIAEVNAKLASGSRSQMEALKNTLDRLNNAGCSIDAHGRPIQR